MKPECTLFLLVLSMAGLSACGPGTPPPPPILPPLVDTQEADHEADHDAHHHPADVSDPSPEAVSDTSQPEAAGGHAHHHGHAEMVLVVSGQQLEIELVSPLANFLPFEHEPRSAEEEEALASLTLALSDATALVTPSDRAGCASQDSRLTTERDGDHATLVASYVLDCTAAQNLEALTLTGFNTYPGLQEVDIILLTSTGQKAAVLTPAAPILKLEH